MDGFRTNLQDVVNMQPVHTLLDAIQLATRAELQLARRMGFRNQPSTRTVMPSLVQNQSEPSKGKAVTEAGQSQASQNQNKAPWKGQTHSKTSTSSSRTQSDPYAPSRSDKCYRCGEAGHYSNRYPQRRTANVVKHEEEEGRQEEENFEEEDPAEWTHEDEGVSLVVQPLMYTPRKEDV